MSQEVLMVPHLLGKWLVSRVVTVVPYVLTGLGSNTSPKKLL